MRKSSSDLTDVQQRLDNLGGLLDYQYEELNAAIDALLPCDTILWGAEARERPLTDTEKAKLKEHLSTIDGLLKGVRKRAKQIRRQLKSV